MRIVSGGHVSRTSHFNNVGKGKRKTRFTPTDAKINTLRITYQGPAHREKKPLIRQNEIELQVALLILSLARR